MKIAGSSGRYKMGLRERCHKLTLTATSEVEAEALATFMLKLASGGVGEFVGAQIKVAEVNEQIWDGDTVK